MEIVTQTHIDRAADAGACIELHIGTHVSSFTYADLIWAAKSGIVTTDETAAALRSISSRLGLNLVITADVSCEVLPGSGYGDGDGSGDGDGFGYGSGDGSGFGYGFGFGDGYGDGYGDGDGDGYGYGFGNGAGLGSGSGFGSGSGSGE